MKARHRKILTTQFFSRNPCFTLIIQLFKSRDRASYKPVSVTGLSSETPTSYIGEQSDLSHRLTYKHNFLLESLRTNPVRSENRRLNKEAKIALVQKNRKQNSTEDCSPQNKNDENRLKNSLPWIIPLIVMTI